MEELSQEISLAGMNYCVQIEILCILYKFIPLKLVEKEPPTDILKLSINTRDFSCDKELLCFFC